MRDTAISTKSKATNDSFNVQFASDVQYYLMQQPRQLPSRYLYDELGSALFEAICRLPWYRIPPAERRLLHRHAREIVRHVRPTAMVELGSGSGEKLRALVNAAGFRARRLNIHLVDLSPAALSHAVRTLSSLDDVTVTKHAAAYEAGLVDAIGALTSADRTLVLFLGSNIGNFDPPACEAFVRGIRRELKPGDALLVGADLVKPERDLLLAYDDPLGVTAAFNRNLLVRINRELRANFRIDRFAHRAVWNAPDSRIEMHLVSAGEEHVRVGAADIEFTMRPGEMIWTESSYKYRGDDLVTLMEMTGFRVSGRWIDLQDGFSLTLADAI